VAEHFGVQSDVLGAVSTRVGGLGCRATGVVSVARARVATAAGLLGYDAQRLGCTCGRYPAIRAGLGLGHLIIGSALVMGFSHGRRGFSMRGVDDGGDALAAVTLRERN
jgi:hypothetical protein